MENVIVNPDPKRLINGLRDTGYSFYVAVADLIDNSISAGANQIYLYITMDYEGEVFLKIIDNGCGMDKLSLIDAMKYGSTAKNDPRSLSKFGLGMKTASTSFCRRLSVTSRGEQGGRVYKATWDLDHVSETGQWELLLSEPDQEDLENLTRLCGDGTGTLVSWSKVDRLLRDNGNASPQRMRNSLKKYVSDLEEHISMVYQRFLDVDDPREPQKIRIWLNDKEIEYWDPFCSKVILPAQEETIEVRQSDDSVLGEFTVRAFILPRREEFPDQNTAIKAKITNQRQGFYIYRENRLIHEGDWMKIYAMEPHYSLLRVEFSFTSELDEAFQVDIKKSRITLNSALESWVQDDFLPPVRRAAEDRYRKGKKKLQDAITVSAHGSSNRNIEGKVNEISKATVEVIDSATNEALVKNEKGVTSIRLKIEASPKNPGDFFVEAVDSIDEGLLWEPALIAQKQAVRINKSHAYYQKVYMPSIINRDTSVGTIEGMDALLWALSIAELKTVNQATLDYFNDLRYDVSRILRKLVENLPDPPEVNGNGG